MQPTISPTFAPTMQPTTSPSFRPTFTPVLHPTFATVPDESEYAADIAYVLYSENIIDLRLRGDLTYSNYYLPDKTTFDENGRVVNYTNGKDRSYCTTCILSSPHIDALIELKGCDYFNISILNASNPNSFYHCDTGTWLLRTSARLANWQDTYGRLEIWEVDESGLKWLKYKQEFNWWNTTCTVDNNECDVLPLTD
eukprot:305001_1